MPVLTYSGPALNVTFHGAEGFFQLRQQFPCLLFGDHQGRGQNHGIVQRGDPGRVDKEPLVQAFIDE
ncbi:hypothetical protein D9M69_570820 [compost metagenome]